MHTMVVQAAVALGIVVATSCGSGSIAVDIDPDSIVGCRAPIAGCEECCVQFPSGYDLLSSSPGSDWYNVISLYDGVCPTDKPTCARCSDRDEQQLRDLAANPQCECAGVHWGNDPCFSDGCDCFCSRLVPLLEQCTGASP